jgi:hypothetical protein
VSIEMPPGLNSLEKWAWENATPETRRWWAERLQGARVWAKRKEEENRRRAAEREEAYNGWLHDAKTLRLVVKDPEGFSCRNLVHFAVALADLDCRVRVHDGPAPADIAGGRVTRPGFEGAWDMIAGEPVKRGEVITFRVGGPDAEAALPIIRETFARGLEDHLAVVRKFVRMNEKRRTA